MANLTKDELLDVLETAFNAQLKAVRSMQRKSASPKARSHPKGRSNIDIVVDVLSAAPGPLHINEIIHRAQAQCNRKLSRESLVSALTKKVLDQQTFKRVAANTFDLIHREE